MNYDEWTRACIAEILTTAPEDLEQKVADIHAEHLFLFGGRRPPDAIAKLRDMLMVAHYVPKLTPKAPHPYAGESWRRRRRNART